MRVGSNVNTPAGLGKIIEKHGQQCLVKLSNNVTKWYHKDDLREVKH